MTTAWSRRALLATGGGAALALGLPAAASASDSASPSALPNATATDGAADEFAALRAKWRDLYLGTGFSPTAEPFKSKLADLGTQATGYHSTMAPARGSSGRTWSTWTPIRTPTRSRSASPPT